MKVYLILGVKLILIWLAVYYFTDPHREMARHDSDPICLQSTTDYQLCAQCFRKGDDVIRSKGFRVVTTNTSSVLKIPGADEYLTCSELLQLVDFQQDSSSGQEFHLEEVRPITRILN